jgi:hypothetical protein
MRGAELQSAIRSLACRVMLSLSLSLTAMSRSTLSQDVHLHSLVHAKVNRMCLELARGTTSAMGRSLGLVLRTIVTEGNEYVGNVYLFCCTNTTTGLLADHANKTPITTRS